MKRGSGGGLSTLPWINMAHIDILRLLLILVRGHDLRQQRRERGRVSEAGEGQGSFSTIFLQVKWVVSPVKVVFNKKLV